MTKCCDDAAIAGRARGAPPPGAAGPSPLPGRGVPPMFLQTLPRILIVRTGSTAVEVQRAHGDYDRWFRDALAKHDLAFDLCAATRAPIPDTTSHVGVIVTGSVKSVLRPEPWMDGLAAFLRRSVSQAQGRTYAGGLTKFEPGEMERLPVPAPALLPAYASSASTAAPSASVASGPLPGNRHRSRS